MPNIIFTPIPTADAQKWWDGGKDAYEQPLERRISDGGAPCRHCLNNIQEGKPVLLGAYKPFQQRDTLRKRVPYSCVASHATALLATPISCHQL